MTGLLQDYIVEQAVRAGHATALVMGDERITYAELELASNRLARLLRQVGCSSADRVCVLGEKSPAAIIAMIATLKAGCAYVPLDPASPAARVARIVRSAAPAAALVSGSAAGRLKELLTSGALAPKLPVGALDAGAMDDPSVRCAFGPEDVTQEAGDPLPSVGASSDPAHILFTSGSTGEPKGVVITHANVSAFVEWAVAYFGIRSQDRISGAPPLHFDLSTFDIYGAFRAGAELHLVPPHTLMARQLADFISTSRLTQWFSVPSTMSYMAKLGAVPDDGFPSLERVLWCGEVLPTPVLIHWMQRVRQARFTNLYGPTETTIASSYHTLAGIPSDPAAPIPIGEPCAGEELLVLSEQSEPLPAGEVGGLHIGGAGLSPGYWRDELKTRSAFIPDPRPGHGQQRLYRTGDLARVDSDGLFYFLGRTDSQIKSRGYRIELGEIEAAINTIPGVAECAVIGVDSDGFEGTSICCAFAPVKGADLTPTQLRAELRSALPSYMLPSRWTSMGALPKNVNGKIDRRRLRQRFTAEAALPAQP